MKRALIITAHPDHPGHSSFNQELTESVRATLTSNGAETRVRDLYTLHAEGFDPVLSSKDLSELHQGRTPEPIAREQKHLEWATHLVMIYPLWWWDRPAVLKGYIDRVFSYGYAYEVGAQGPVGKLGHLQALVFQTAGNPREYFIERNALSAIEGPMLEGTLRFCGIRASELTTFFSVPRALADEKIKMLSQAREQTIRFISSSP